MGSVRKTFKYRLTPTPAQEQVLEEVLWRCRELYNAGLEERKAAWEKCDISVNFAMQSAQLPGIKEVRPEYRGVNAQVLQDVLHRLTLPTAKAGGFSVQHRSYRHGSLTGLPGP